MTGVGSWAVVCQPLLLAYWRLYLHIFFADNLEKLLMSSECLGLAHFREIVIQFLFLLWILVYFIFSWTAPNLFFLGFISVVSSVPSSLPLFKNLWILKQIRGKYQRQAGRSHIALHVISSNAYMTSITFTTVSKPED